MYDVLTYANERRMTDPQGVEPPTMNRDNFWSEHTDLNRITIKIKQNINEEESLDCSILKRMIIII